MINLRPTPRVKAETEDSSLLSRVSNTLFSLIIFLSSTQLGLHFWPQSALVHGVRIDYLSPTLYLLDLLIFVYLVIKKNKLINIDFKLLSIFPVLLANLIFSINPLSTLNWLIHLLLYVLFISTISLPHNFLQLIKSLTLSSIFQLILATTQLILSSSVQGIFYFFGERQLNLSSSNVAKWELFGNLLLRPYGTFSHPNALAGWLIIATLIVGMGDKYKNRIYTFSLSAFSTLGIILTQSRSAAFSFFGFIIPSHLLKKVSSRKLYFPYLLMAISLFVYLSLHLPRTNLSVLERIKLQELSFRVISRFPLFGTGANASIASYPSVSPSFRLLQPDHDSLTLLFSWFGLTGLLSSLYFIKSFRKGLIALFPILPLLFLDHYLLTSPQGLFILLLYLRLALGKKNKTSS